MVHELTAKDKKGNSLRITFKDMGSKLPGFDENGNAFECLTSMFTIVGASDSVDYYVQYAPYMKKVWLRDASWPVSPQETIADERNQGDATVLDSIGIDVNTVHDADGNYMFSRPGEVA